MSSPSTASQAGASASSTGSSTPIRRVAILFAGGPAPAANAVISTAAASFLKNGIEVVGIMNGYSNLMEFGDKRPLVKGKDYITLDHTTLKRSRNTRGILIGTARANPGKDVSHPSHLNDAERTKHLATVHRALTSLGVDALVSIGGDDTLKTANKFRRFQDHLPADAKRIRVVHVPKTIDNDYRGIDFTFGYFTAVDFLANEIRNLLADAEANRIYFLAESMGRSAGWLAYGVAIAGEASLVLSIEDLTDEYMTSETVKDSKGETITRRIMNLDKVIGRIVQTMLAREKENKEFGVIVLAEGLAQFLPAKDLEGATFDDHGHLSLSQSNLANILIEHVNAAYTKATGKKRRVVAVQLGYEARCAVPHAFDVILGSQLGVGAYLALAEKGLDGVLISVSGQLNLHYVPFDTLVDPETLVTVVRYIERGSDFHRLAHLLETIPEVD